MANVQQTRSAPFGAIFILKVVELAEDALKMAKAKYVANRTYNELSRLSSAQLRDIGLGDQDLDAFCRTIADRT